MQRYVIHACKRCRRTIRATINVQTRQSFPKNGIGYPWTETSVNGGPFIRRPLESQIAAIACACGGHAPGRLIHATTSSRHKCDARCMAATGPVCNCSCNGANHGASYAGISCVAVEDAGLFAGAA